MLFRARFDHQNLWSIVLRDRNWLKETAILNIIPEENRGEFLSDVFIFERSKMAKNVDGTQGVILG